jgi:hypothetical protein
MPQEFRALQCYSCKAFQAALVTKSPKWACKLCGAKQSLQRVYAISGSAKDIRLHVQSLNQARLTTQEQQGVRSLHAPAAFWLKFAMLDMNNAAAMTIPQCQAQLEDALEAQWEQQLEHGCAHDDAQQVDQLHHVSATGMHHTAVPQHPGWGDFLAPASTPSCMAAQQGVQEENDDGGAADGDDDPRFVTVVQARKERKARQARSDVACSRQQDEGAPNMPAYGRPNKRQQIGSHQQETWLAGGNGGGALRQRSWKQNANTHANSTLAKKQLADNTQPHREPGLSRFPAANQRDASTARDQAAPALGIGAWQHPAAAASAQLAAHSWQHQTPTSHDAAQHAVQADTVGAARRTRGLPTSHASHSAGWHTYASSGINEAAAIQASGGAWASFCGVVADYGGDGGGEGAEDWGEDAGFVTAL